MSRKNISIVIAAIILIGIGILLSIVFTNAAAKDSPYSAVYLTSGDIYFGKLSWFPKPHLESAWHLDRTVDQNNKPQTTLVPMKSALWGPSDELYLNEKQIIFWTKLRADSQVAKLLADPQSAPQPTSGSPVIAPVSTPPATHSPGATTTPHTSSGTTTP